jgi:GT2 family glycosyltransferase
MILWTRFMPGALASALLRRWRILRRDLLLPDESRRGRAYVAFRRALQRALDAVNPPPPPPPPPLPIDPAELEARAAAERARVRAAAQRRYVEFQSVFEPGAASLDAQRAEASADPPGPLFSVVTPVFAPGVETFQLTAASLLAQTYPHWTWHVADGSPDDAVWQLLVELARTDSRVKPVRLASNRGIAGNTNAALDAAGGDFVAMLDHDDTIAPNALWTIARAIEAEPLADFLYSDCDKLDEAGVRCDPFFKPDWSPELALGCNYLDQFAVFRRALLERVGPLDGRLDAAQDWDFYLRLAGEARAIVHVPAVLYHWRKTPGSTASNLDNKPGVREAQRAAVERQLARLGLQNPTAAFDPGHPVHAHFPKLTWALPGRARVSVVIPTRDHAAMLATCLDGLLGATDYRDLEVILVDTGSVEPETARLYAMLGADARVRLTHDLGSFNFSRACNAGARLATGDLLLLLNNDVEILHPDWLARMAQWFAISGVGVVGATLMFPDRTVQHGGVVVGFGGLASNLFMHGAEYADSVFGPEGWYRNLSAVSGACLLTSRDVYDALGGLDESFILNYSDVDYCARASARGHRVVLTPDARLIHHESVTHGRRAPRADFERATVCLGDLLRRGDPYFNPNLSMHNCHPSVRLDPRDNAHDANVDLMARLPRKTIIEMPADLQPRSDAPTR